MTIARYGATDIRASTVGNHIAFNHSEYDSESPEGQHVLAHELAHVRQQTGGAVSMLPKEEVDLEIDPDPRLEREAEEAAQAAMTDGTVTINRMGTEAYVQRSPIDTITSKAKDAIGMDGDEGFAEYIDDIIEDKLEERFEETADSVQSFGTSLAQGGQKAKQGITDRAPSVGYDLSTAYTKGALGSIAGAAAGTMVGAPGGAALGATLGAAAGTVVGPIGTAVGAEAGRRLGAEAGKALVGGAASDTTKQIVDYTIEGDYEEQITELTKEFKQLEKKLNELRNTSSDLDDDDETGLR